MTTPKREEGFTGNLQHQRMKYSTSEPKKKMRYTELIKKAPRLKKNKQEPLQKPADNQSNAKAPKKPYESPMFAGMRKKFADDKAAKQAQPKPKANMSKYKQAVAARKARVREHEAGKSAARGRRQVMKGKPG